MIWQDLLIMIGGFGFGLALIPSMRAKEKPAPTTSLLTGSILLSFCVAYASLGLWFAFSATIIVALGWYFLLGQALRRKK